jgi:hypothetical protein
MVGRKELAVLRLTRQRTSLFGVRGLPGGHIQGGAATGAKFRGRPRAPGGVQGGDTEDRGTGEVPDVEYWTS